MTPRLAYDDASTAQEMATDAHAVADALRPPAPGIRCEDQPDDPAQPEVHVSEAAARLAAAMHPHTS